jgi:hypothetical protein
MLLVWNVCRPLVVVVLCLLPVGLTACGSAAPTPASTQAVTEAAVTEGLAPANPTAPGETGDTTASSLAHQDTKSEEVRSSSIATLHMVPVADGQALEVRVADVRDLYAIDMEIRFDATRMQVSDADAKMDGVQIKPGQLPRPDFVAINTADNERGIIRYVVTQLGGEAAFSGGGVVATIAWEKPADTDADVSVAAATLVSAQAEPIEAAVKP